MELQLTNFTKKFGDKTVIENMDLRVKSGEMIALLGPSGCGKSTTLFAICGIHRIDGGALTFGEKNVTKTPAQTRNVGVVFQNYALYPHMSVADNIAFPLRVQKISKAERTRKVSEIAAMVHIEDLLDRRPAQLSGGQQQRVALARALVREPDILLMDEPLANLDAKLRLEMRSEIRRVQQETGITAILVTHDQVEAMSMCDRIALMQDGKIIQMGVPTEMYGQPASRFVASFLGNPPISFVPKGTLDIDVKNAVEHGVRPECFGPQFGSEIAGVVKFVEQQGREDLFDVALDDGTLLRSVQRAGSGVALGDRIAWGVDENNILHFDATGARL